MGVEADHEEWLRGELIAERKAKGWSLERVARAVARELDVDHVPRQAIHKWENDQSALEMRQWRAWANALGFRIDMDLVRSKDGLVILRVQPDVAAIAREMTLLSSDDRTLLAGLVARLRAGAVILSPVG